ncbi:MAG: hypothetical protein HY558_02460 [Euryarchaeota archaeon]|nr:hypothetical protein [Euryarchaeota archaeon]
MLLFMALFGKKKEEEKAGEKKEETPGAAPAGGAPEAPGKPADPARQEDEAGKLGETSEEKAARMEVEEAARGREEEKAPGVEELVLRIEKMDGRLSAAEESRARMDDRLARMSEQIGELRTMGLERERSMGLMEADFELIKAVFEEVKPSEIAKELERKEKSITQLGVRTEKLERLLERFGDDVRQFREVLDKIKGLENLVELQKMTTEQAERADEAKKYIDRMAAKTESIFGELSTKLLVLDTTVGKVETLDELAREMTKTLDSLETRTKGFVSIDEMKDYTKKPDLEALVKVEDAKLLELEKSLRPLIEEAQKEMGGLVQGVAHFDDRIRKVEGPPQQLWEEVENLRGLLKRAISRPDLDTLLKEKAQLEAAKDKEGLAIVEAQIDEVRRTGRLLRMVEEQSGLLEKLAKASLLTPEDLETLRKRIQEEDIAEVRKGLEERIHKVEIPPELRKTLQREVTAEVKEAVSEELRRAEILMNRKMEGVEKLRTTLEEGVKSIPEKVESRVAQATAGVEGLQKRLAGVEARQNELHATVANRLENLEVLQKKVEEMRKELVRTRAQSRTLEEFLREKESILTILDTLKIKHEEGMISPQTYEETLREHLDRLAEIDARVEDITTRERLAKRVEAAEKTSRELADIARNFLTREEWDRSREKFQREEMERLRGALEKTFAHIPKEMETRVNELKFQLARLSDQARKAMDEERFRAVLADFRKEVLRVAEEVVSSQVGRALKDTGRREEVLREELETSRRDLQRRLERIPSEFEPRFLEMELRGRELTGSTESLERQVESLQREIALLTARNTRRGLEDLVQEREKLMTAIHQHSNGDR